LLSCDTQLTRKHHSLFAHLSKHRSAAAHACRSRYCDIELRGLFYGKRKTARESRDPSHRNLKRPANATTDATRKTTKPLERTHGIAYGSAHFVVAEDLNY